MMGRTRKPHIQYSDRELAWIKTNRHRPQREACEAFCRKFSRDDVSYENYRGLCKRKGWTTGRTGHFPKGHISHNKGKKMPFNANSARTQFKKGNLPHNTKFDGHERIGPDGYVWMRVSEPNPWTGASTHYVQKHRRLWEEANGPIPPDHVLKCLDGNKQNTDPDNWECIPRAMLPRLNGKRGRNYEEASEELKPIIMATTKLEHVSRTARKGTK
jgi:hypothetical protein